MPVTRQNFEQLGLPAGPYTHAVTHAETLYTSGFTAFGTPAAASGAGDQTRAVLNQLAFIAQQHGKDLDALLKVTVFVTNPADIPEIREALAARYGCHVPASSLVVISELFAPDLKVEIEAVFAL
ncbi:RidA family protein [Roseibium sp.]|uniref:RidA family protein n=1 Tax=Roseibium sp. TaxID=1936156 RepID=UPI003D0D3771